MKRFRAPTTLRSSGTLGSEPGFLGLNGIGDRVAVRLQLARTTPVQAKFLEVSQNPAFQCQRQQPVTRHAGLEVSYLYQITDIDSRAVFVSFSLLIKI